MIEKELKYEELKKSFKFYVLSSVATLFIGFISIIINLTTNWLVGYEFIYLVVFSGLILFSFNYKKKLVQTTNDFIGNENGKYGDNRKIFKDGLTLSQDPRINHSEFVKLMRKK